MTIVQERAKHWTNIFAKNYYGDTVENLIEKEREKERERAIKLHFEKKWTLNAIAEFLEIPVIDVQKIIDKHIAEKGVKA